MLNEEICNANSTIFVKCGVLFEPPKLHYIFEAAVWF